MQIAGKGEIVSFFNSIFIFLQAKGANMNFFKKPVIFFAVILFGMPFAGIAQYQFQVNPFFSYFTDLHRYELGFNYGLLSPGTFDGVVPIGSMGAGLGDTTAKRALNAVSYGGSIGLSVPFKATGHISCWVMDLTLMANMSTWSALNETYQIDGSYSTVNPDLEASTLQVALPIGVSWKVGNDAICTKRLPFCASFGAGFIPQYNITNINSVQDVKAGNAFGCTPYAKVEIGAFIGICAKLRFTYTMGDITMIDVNHPISGVTDGPFKITSTGNLLATLVLIPFSAGWKETAWWNTHDTYNIHDKLN